MLKFMLYFGLAMAAFLPPIMSQEGEDSPKIVEEVTGEAFYQRFVTFVKMTEGNMIMEVGPGCTATEKQTQNWADVVRAVRYAHESKAYILRNEKKFKSTPSYEEFHEDSTIKFCDYKTLVCHYGQCESCDKFIGKTFDEEEQKNEILLRKACGVFDVMVKGRAAMEKSPGVINNLSFFATISGLFFTQFFTQLLIN